MRTNKPRTFLTVGLFVSVFLALVSSASCRRENGVVIENGSPLRFIVSGPGTLSHFQVSGPDLEREPHRQGDGERLTLLKVYWELVPSVAATTRSLDKIRSISYGQVPDGFVQVYPQEGAPPALIERDLYNVTLAANTGRGVNMFFSVRDGRIVAEGQK